MLPDHHLPSATTAVCVSCGWLFGYAIGAHQRTGDGRTRELNLVGEPFDRGVFGRQAKSRILPFRAL